MHTFTGVHDGWHHELKNSASRVIVRYWSGALSGQEQSANREEKDQMSSFADELLHRISDARQALSSAQQAGDLDSERVYAGELDSLLRMAMENGVTVPLDVTFHPGSRA